MSEMIERVAKAVYESHPYVADYLQSDPKETSWEDCPEFDKEECRIIARAAIAVMREPTEEMSDAVCSDVIGFDRDPETYWQAMIDAALKS